MTDAAFLYHCLEDGNWHGQAEILSRSMRERGCGLTVHSRAADLRKRGCVVECELRRNGHGRSLSYYRLVTLNEVPVSDAALEASTSDSAAGTSLSVPATHSPGSPSSPAVTRLPAGATAGTLSLFEEPSRGAYGDAA